MSCYQFSFARPIIGVLLAACVVTLASVTIQAQSGKARNPVPESGQNSQPLQNESQRIQRDAVRRLAKLIGEAKQIADPAARARVLARLADVFWKRDEKRARELFQIAYDDCLLIFTPAVSERAESDLTSSLTCGTARSEIIRLVTARDPEFAHRLAAQMTQENNCSFDPRDRNTYENPKAVFIVQVAIALAEKNPVAAAGLGRQSLQFGIVYCFPELLIKLKASDAGLADDLISAAIARIASDYVNALEFVTLGRYLVDDYLTTPQKNKPSGSEKNVETARAVSFLDSTLSATSRFVNLLGRKGEAVGPEHQVFSEAASISEKAASFFVALTDLLPSFERYHSTRLADARALIKRLGDWMDPIERDHMFVFYDNGDTPESLIAEAEASAEVKSRDELYFLATSLADLKGDFDKALSIASRIGDSERRNDTIDGFYGNQVLKAVNEGRDVEARRLASQIKKPERRMMEMLLISGHVFQAGHNTQTISWLDETTAMLLQAYPSPSPEQAEMLMAIAREYVKVDPGRGFTAMKNAINAINAAAGQPVDPEARRRFGRPVSPTDPLSLFGFEMSAFESLARRDYFRSLRLARSFDDKSLAMIAQLAVVRAVVFASR